MLVGFTIIEPRYQGWEGKFERVVFFFQFSLTRLGIARVVDIRVYGLPKEVFSHCCLSVVAIAVASSAWTTWVWYLRGFHCVAHVIY